LNGQRGCASLAAMTRSATPKADFPASAIFDWYDRHGRSLPWRHRWPDLAPAYHVWLSEIMLQQTVVATVIPYFLDFTRRWPDVCSLANASNEDVMAAWAGLGYYARARNLHRAARQVCDDHGGQFPSDVPGLRELPGIGPYTAGAIAAIAFGRQSTVIDGNIERVMARYFAISTPLPAAKVEIAKHYDAIRPRERPSDFPQALMDFANAVCTPKSPACLACPLAAGCAARAAGTPEAWPVKAPKKSKPERRGIAYVAIDKGGQAFMVTRPETGMLGGMLAFPSAGWTPADPDYDPAVPEAGVPFAANWKLAAEPVTHVFTHFSLSMDVMVARLPGAGMAESWGRVRPASLPTLMRKVWDAAQKTG
jgi:A/G-specific adenine glycosylase